MKLLRGVSFLFGAIACLGSCAINAAASEQDCAPPEEFKAKLHGKPTVDVLNDLGVWFADQEKYACAADAFGSSLQTDAAQPGLPPVVFEFRATLYLYGT